MLWYKAWLETRFRFLVGVLLVSALCGFFVFGHDFILGTWRDHRQAYPTQRELPWILRATEDYSYFIWHFVFRRLFQQLWVVFALVIALGGLSREKAQGTAGFTLSLPVGRRRMVFVRAAVGLAEIAILGLLPALLIPSLSALLGKSYSFEQAFSHGVLMIIGGVVFYGLGVFLSTVIESEHTPALIGVSLIVFYYFMMGPYTDDGVIAPLWLRAIDVSRLMAGEPGPVGWASYPFGGIAFSLLVGAGLFFLSLKITEERDF